MAWQQLKAREGKCRDRGGQMYREVTFNIGIIGQPETTHKPQW